MAIPVNTPAPYTRGPAPSATYLFTGPEPTALAGVLRQAAKRAFSKSAEQLKVGAEKLAKSQNLPALFEDAKGTSFSEVITNLVVKVANDRRTGPWSSALSHPDEALIYFVIGRAVDQSAAKLAALRFSDDTQLTSGLSWEVKIDKKAGDEILAAFGVVNRNTLPPAGENPLNESAAK